MFVFFFFSLCWRSHGTPEKFGRPAVFDASKVIFLSIFFFFYIKKIQGWKIDPAVHTLFIYCKYLGRMFSMYWRRDTLRGRGSVRKEIPYNPFCHFLFLFFNALTLCQLYSIIWADVFTHRITYVLYSKRKIFLDFRSMMRNDINSQQLSIPIKPMRSPFCGH